MQTAIWAAMAAGVPDRIQAGRQQSTIWDFHDVLRIYRDYNSQHATMLQMLGFDDNKKIGMFLLFLAAALYFLGILLLFTRSFLLLSNLLYLAGLYFFIGLSGILKFFAKKGKVKGSVLYCSGLIIITLGYAFIGALTQLTGFFLIFRSFLPEVYDYICRTPLVGRYLKSFRVQSFLDGIAGNQTIRI